MRKCPLSRLLSKHFFLVDGALGFHNETVLAGRGAMGVSGYLENPDSPLWMYQTVHEKPSGSAGSEDVPDAHFFWKPCLADMGMAEAVSPHPTGWSRAAFLVAPARTFLLGERN